MVDYVRLPAAGLIEVAARIFQAAGGARDEAVEIATNLVGANLAGHRRGFSRPHGPPAASSRSPA